MENESNIYFQTNIIKPNIKIIALSDIHGDIQSLIISLRDCGGVIKKKSNFNPDKYDEDLETELNKNLNNTNARYLNDLGYEWIGLDTHVVICGDMIDPNRTKLCKKSNGDGCTYYPQIEIKILLFINALNEQASKYDGRIIKLLGNHELVNTTSGEISEYFISKYSFDNDNNNDNINDGDNNSINSNYYKGISRNNIFNVGQEGFRLLFKDGCGILVKINNYIFIHGGLASKSYDYFNQLNQWFNNPSNQILSENKQLIWNDKIDQSKLNDSIGNSPLWIRDLGDPSEMSRRIGISNTNSIVNSNQDNFCSNLTELFRIFKGDGKIIRENPSDLTLIIGHCVQSDLSTQQNKISYSGNLYNHGQTYMLEDKKRSNSQIDVFNTSIYTGPSVFDRSDRTKVFGISMDCVNKSNSNSNSNNNIAKLYRIDVGSSRGYDYFTGNDNKIKSPEDELKFIYSKTPQILLIDYDNTVHIIKSKIKNTRIHLPRDNYESAISNVDDLDISNPSNLHYKLKYLKYKKKYMKLKNII